MSTAEDRSLFLAFDDVETRLDVGQSLTFGRSAELVIDSSNRSMHRELGRFSWADGQWHLTNLGRSITLVATDLDGASFARVTPGASVPLPFPRTAISFSAGRANYRLSAHRRPSAIDDVPDPDDHGYEKSNDLTITASTLEFNDDQLALLGVLARLRADGPITIDDIPSNRQLAHQLGWTPSKLSRKLDHLCLKLDRAGVTGLVGDTAETAKVRRLVLANLAVEHALVDVSRDAV